jgi:citrate lyase subunit beta/citryl-CoA lyase
MIDLEARYLAQMAHLTTPATVWKYVESAATKSEANLVMLDLEDSVPRGSDDTLALGRDNVVRALRDLDWGPRLRFFRPRGTALDPEHADIADVVTRAKGKLDGLVFPKVEGEDEVRAVDARLAALEESLGLERGRIKLEVLIESAQAEERAFDIARASSRLAGLIFGAFDYWASLGLSVESYRIDHPIAVSARVRVVKAAASAGVPAIAEMTLNYPTKDKSPEEQRAALDECRRDALFARDLGFRGKWTGIPAQTAIAREVFEPKDAEIAAAVAAARAFGEAEKRGLGAVMIDGKMADRAIDRIHRVTLKTAYALGRLDAATARELGVV